MNIYSLQILTCLMNISDFLIDYNTVIPYQLTSNGNSCRILLFKIIMSAISWGQYNPLSRLLDVDIMKGLKYIGGYRASIIQSGIISVNDEIIY